MNINNNIQSAKDHDNFLFFIAKETGAINNSYATSQLHAELKTDEYKTKTSKILDELLKKEDVNFLYFTNHPHIKDRIPQIHISACFWQFEVIFKKNIIKFLEDKALFFELFDEDMLEKTNYENDKKVQKMSPEEKREHFKRVKDKKHYTLYSAQLLKLIGRNASKYITKNMLKEYIETEKDRERFLNNYRLISSSNLISKIPTHKKKREQETARILNINRTQNIIAKDRGFTFALITLTLPPEFHPNPTTGGKKYDGRTPNEAVQTLSNYWQLIRSNLNEKGIKVGRDFFGAWTNEVHKDTTLHKHVLMYFDKKNLKTIRKVVKNVAKKQEVKFDFKLNDRGEDGDGAAYIFKYIIKNLEHEKGEYKNHNKRTGNEETKEKEDNRHINKSKAIMSYYQTKRFEFFGMNFSISKFNFATQTFYKFQDFYSEELKATLKNYDFYNFNRHFKDFFKIVRNEEKQLDFVVFDKSANDAIRFDKEKYRTDINKKLKVLNLVNVSHNQNKESNNFVILHKDSSQIFELYHLDDPKILDEIHEETKRDTIALESLTAENFEKLSVESQNNILRSSLLAEHKEKMKTLRIIQFIFSDLFKYDKETLNVLSYFFDELKLSEELIKLTNYDIKELNGNKTLTEQSKDAMLAGLFKDIVNYNNNKKEIINKIIKTFNNKKDEIDLNKSYEVISFNKISLEVHNDISNCVDSIIIVDPKQSSDNVVPKKTKRSQKVPEEYRDEYEYFLKNR